MGVPKPKVGATSAFTAFSGRKQSDDHAAAILRLRQSSWQRGQVGGLGCRVSLRFRCLSLPSACSPLLAEHAMLVLVLSRGLAWLAATG